MQTKMKTSIEGEWGRKIIKLKDHPKDLIFKF